MEAKHSFYNLKLKSTHLSNERERERERESSIMMKLLICRFHIVRITIKVISQRWRSKAAAHSEAPLESRPKEVKGKSRRTKKPSQEKCCFTLTSLRLEVVKPHWHPVAVLLRLRTFSLSLSSPQINKFKIK